MTLDVTWDGVVLARGAQAREQDGGWFVELEQPMPVGTTLALSGDVQAVVQVARVHEGLGAGMVVTKADSQQPTADSQQPTADSQKPESDENGKADENGKPDDAGGAKKEKRKRGRRS